LIWITPRETVQNIELLVICEKVFIYRMLGDFHRFGVNFIEFSWVAGIAVLFKPLHNKYQKTFYLSVIINYKYFNGNI